MDAWKESGSLRLESVLPDASIKLVENCLGKVSLDSVPLSK
jgi:hypothetical protein